MLAKNWFFILLLLLFIFSCEKEESTPQKKYGTGKVNFSDLKIGQKSTYLSFIGICNDEFEFGDQFFADTLLLEVVDMNDEILTFSESLTKGSGQNPTGQLQTIKYEVIKKENYLLIPERDSSALFYFYANDTLHLNPANLVDLRQESCFLMMAESTFSGNEIGLVKGFEVLDNQLNEKIAVSCVPPVITGIENGYLLYDEKGLGVSYSILLSSGGIGGTEFLKRGWIEVGELK